MLGNFLKITIRNFLKHRAYSAINILGLVIGFTAFIFISLYVQYETSWDRHNTKYDRIYRVQRQFTKVLYAMDGNDISPHTRGLTAKLLEERYPEFEKILLIRENSGKFLSSSSERSFYDEYGISADQWIFDIFSYHFLEGIQANGLSEPFTIVLSKKLADKLFPGENATGKTVLIEKKFNLKVTGVYEDLPMNSSLRPSYILSLSSLEKSEDIRNSR
jgi:putative ABC transport system permease protein